MAVNWTDEQKQVIETRGCNILVSAAAGSGKTAVLVERILQRILDPEDPVGIDELLIVTFTKAAAGEMRERITERIAAAREEDPDNAHLAKQSALIAGALITTIDGFCSYVCRNYGHMIGMTPAFKVLDAGEAALMQQDAVRDTLEAAHAEEDPDFRERFLLCLETYAPGKQERPLMEAILRIAEASESAPDPDGWIRGCREDASASTAEEMFTASWMREMMADARAEIETGYALARENLRMTEEAGGPAVYRPSAEADFALFEGLMENAEAGAFGAQTAHGAGRSAACAYDACRRLLVNFAPVRLSAKKMTEGERPGGRDIFKRRRSELGDIEKALLNDYFPFPADDAVVLMRRADGALDTLLELAERYRARYREIKDAKQKMDFPDLEHSALRILADEGGRTQAARELAAHFREVMIDEYQDSNYLQEAILMAVSRNEDGEGNYFCVGDVKQSIYSFRQARPELFLEKAESYVNVTGGQTPCHVSGGVRIDLHRNFRSRGQVIDAVNGIFAQIMRREVGGVGYDADAALVAGASYPPADGCGTEFLAVQTEEDGDGASLTGRLSAQDVRELEARAVGTRIRELMAEGEVYDRALMRMRPVRYRDIVILLRTMEGWADVYAEVLTSMRIPNYQTAKSGYFTAQEVRTVLSVLQIVDNPQQDIPFAAVLRSAYAGLSAEELALVRSADKAVSLSGSTRRADTSLYEAARAYAGEDVTGSQTPCHMCDKGSDPLSHKLQEFFDFYDRIRESAADTPLNELIYRIVHESGFYDYAAALPGGTQRAVNLDMLVDKAAEYGKTSYNGLFNFIRYIENLQRYSQDFGELSTISESEDVVRIYSIHKSKGLEYPIVFVSGMSKQFNTQDINAGLLIHPEMGVAANAVDLSRRTKAPTVKKLAIRRRMLKDSIGEELRVLYVALTRAQQKLILSGAYAGEEKTDERLSVLPDADAQLPVTYIRKCHSPFALLFPAVRRMNERAIGLGLAEIVRVRVMKLSELVTEELESGIRREDALAYLREIRAGEVYDAGVRKELARRFSYRYPHAGSASVPVEVSVSDLKEEAIHGAGGPLRAAEEDAEARAVRLVTEEPAAAGRAPGGLAAEGISLTGAARGTAYHRVCELLDFAAPGIADAGSGSVAGQVAGFVADGRLTADEAGAVRLEDVDIFVRSPLGMRMRAAQLKGDLFREQPFVLGVDASELRAEWPAGEMVFVQGIIDAFFYEGDGIVLLDYKTDRVRAGAELAERYRVQLDLYARALARVTGLPVREKWIWSFALGEEVRM